MTEYRDATRIDGLKRCPAFYNLRYIQGWRPKAPNIHLEFGGLFADALEYYYKLRHKEAFTKEQSLQAVVHRTMKRTHENPLPRATGKTRHTLIRSIIWHIDKYDGDVALLADGSVGVEISFRLPVDHGIVFCGCLDRIIESRGKLYIVDQKTTSKPLNSRFFESYECSDQIFLYSLVAKHLLKSPIRGIIIDGVQVLAGTTKFKREAVIKTPEQIDEWYHDTIDIIRSRGNVLPRNFTSCWKYGSCDFVDVCKASPTQRDKYLDARFELREVWDPTKAR